MKKVFFYISITVIVFILTFITNTVDYDLWARLAVGSIFFQTGNVLKHDIFSYLPTKYLWIDHEWGSGVVFYFFVKYLGVWGIFALKYFIIFAIFILFIKIIKLQANKDTAGIFYFIILGFLLLPGIANLIRSQMFTYLFFTLWIYVLEKSRREENQLIWMLPVTMLLWVNMHGGFLAGIGLVMIYAIGEFLNRKNYLKYFLVLALIIPVTLINPYGFKLWNYIIEASLMPRPYVSEWAPISLSGPFHMMEGIKVHIHTGFIICALLTAFVGIKLYVQKEKPDWTRIILVTLLFYLGVKHQRHTEFFILAIPVLFYHQYINLLGPLKILIKNHGYETPKQALETNSAASCGVLYPPLCGIVQLTNSAALRLRNWSFTNKLNDKFYKIWTAGRYGFGYIILIIIFIYIFPQLSNRIIVDPLMYPVGSFEFIKQNNIPGNLATTFDWGSYAFWKLYPQCKVLIDGRYEEVYPNDVYDIAMQFCGNKGDRQAILRKYKTDILVLSKWKYSPADVLNFTGWKLVYQDMCSVLLLPKDKVKSFYIYPDYNNPIYSKENLSKIVSLN